MSATKLFGFWLPVHDEPSARDAVRMSGLPVLIIGANAALFALLASDSAQIMSSSAIAFSLILLAFRIRAGHAAWVPFALLLFIAFLLSNTVLSYLGWHMAGRTQVGIAQAILSWIIPTICLALAISGWRGWRWLKMNGCGVSF